NVLYGKVNPSGTEDATFATNHGLLFQTATVAPDGKVLLCVATDPQLTIYGFILGRLQANGQIDSFGVPDSIRNGQVTRFSDGTLDQVWVSNRVVAVQPDGKVLFEYLAPPGVFHLVRLNVDGSIDGSF